MNNIGEKLKAARRKKGYRQAWVAKQLGIHRTTYTKYECGWSELPISRLMKVTKLLGLTVEELLNDE